MDALVEQKHKEFSMATAEAAFLLHCMACKYIFTVINLPAQLQQPKVPGKCYSATGHLRWRHCQRPHSLQTSGSRLPVPWHCLKWPGCAGGTQRNSCPERYSGQAPAGTVVAASWMEQVSSAPPSPWRPPSITRTCIMTNTMHRIWLHRTIVPPIEYADIHCVPGCLTASQYCHHAAWQQRPMMLLAASPGGSWH